MVLTLDPSNGDIKRLRCINTALGGLIFGSIYAILEVVIVIFAHNISLERLRIVRGWSGGAKVSCILRHWGVQLILAYSWAKPPILVAGKDKGGMFLFLQFLHFHSCFSCCPSLSSLLLSLLSLFSISLEDDTQNDSQGLTCH